MSRHKTLAKRKLTNSIGHREFELMHTPVALCSGSAWEVPQNRDTVLTDVSIENWASTCKRWSSDSGDKGFPLKHVLMMSLFPN